MSHSERKKAVLSGVTAYFIWGFLPLYWSLFQSMDPYFVFVNRCLWILPCIVLIAAYRGELRQIFDLFRTETTILRTIACALLIGLNWLIYIKGVQSHRVIELGLGYFISPIFSVVLGAAVNNDKLGYWRLTAILFIFLGIMVYGLRLDGLPIYAIGIAITFSLYGLLRGRQKCSPIAGQGAESLVLCAVGAVWMAFGQKTGLNSALSGKQIILLASTGIATAVPLVFFAVAAQKLKVSTLGMLTFVSPFIKILVATILLGERLAKMDVVALGLIWIGLLFYLGEGTSSERDRSEVKARPARP